MKEGEKLELERKREELEGWRRRIELKEGEKLELERTLQHSCKKKKGFCTNNRIIYVCMI